ncbi:unnamed protein product [Triticum turgidum subsp. durum]|uniref:Peroxidase 1 n=1 Tax=Triticum turgidum subsp. durum TaxID=4567 RepID=A0A9R0U3I1_TRITD|nr:unnamed protein product [Triticum turgidum subsp. durum]
MEAPAARGGARMRLRAVAAVVVLAMVAATGRAQLQVGYYDTLCPAAEIIVQQEVSKGVSGSPGTAAGLLRLHFHDCFVRGCDGSVLLDSTAGNQAEKDAPPNSSLRGFEVIDAAKTRLEQACYGVVSCADVLAFAARDALALVGGNSYQVPAGRRDGNVSVAMDPVTPNTFDTNYYANVAANRGLLSSDQALLADNGTAAQVLGYTSSPGTFQTDFASAMVAMGAIGVLTGNQGTIRTNCRVVG